MLVDDKMLTYKSLTAMEFIYAQSPHTMKGLLIGLFFFVDVLGAALAAVILIILGIQAPADSSAKSKNITIYHVLWYIVITMAVAFIGFGIYAAAAMLYRKKNRDRIDNHYNFVVEYYTRHTRRYSDEHEVSM